MKKTLAEIAQFLGAELKGDKTCEIASLATLADAQSGQISFLHSGKYRSQLASTKASAVIVKAEDLDACPSNALIVADPYFAYAKLANLFAYRVPATQQIHPTAVIADSAQLADSVTVGPNVVIEANVVIGANSIISAGCVIGEAAVIGEHCQLAANVTLYHHVQLGNQVIVHSGAVIGSDGFGNVMHEGRWQKIPQIGSVIIADDVEIGANTTIDRGALGDTKIGKGARIDNQIQIAHNVEIGEHTAMAACVGVAGSAKIGRYCMIGGGARINGHIEIADKSVITGTAMITNSIKEPGYYSSGTGQMKTQDWRKSVVRFRQLDKLAKRVSQLEKRSKGE
jgi:UDP-3-O-[3-hydroxymyristoyl] glucosamine N-acyltransferase